MPAFEYEALDPAGKRKKGLITADSELAARRELRGQSLAPLSIGRADERRQVTTSSGNSTSVSFDLSRQHLSSRELMLITRQLASLIDAGMPVAEALGLIGNQLDKHHMRRVLLAVRSRVTEGERFSEALAGFPKSFPPVYCALVAAGETSGGLGQVLERLADYLEKEQAVRNRIVGALIYPALLTCVAIGVVSMLMLFVVPRIAEQFTGMGVTLPLLTRIMIGISDPVGQGRDGDAACIGRASAASDEAVLTAAKRLEGVSGAGDFPSRCIFQGTPRLCGVYWWACR